jgi:hypothetical protein
MAFQYPPSRLLTNYLNTPNPSVPGCTQTSFTILRRLFRKAVQQGRSE